LEAAFLSGLRLDGVGGLPGERLAGRSTGYEPKRNQRLQKL
jgi:hypothetical protein